MNSINHNGISVCPQERKTMFTSTSPQDHESKADFVNMTTAIQMESCSQPLDTHLKSVERNETCGYNRGLKNDRQRADS